MKYPPRDFFNREVLEVARDLLGCILIREFPDGARLVARIVETEAYAGSGDPASHSHKGKTSRNAVMFGPAGYLYVYFTYGMHFCCNIVTGPEDRADAVLLRAAEPLEGIALMAENRYGTRDITQRQWLDLCRGPARLCQAFGIGRSENGAGLYGGEFSIVLSGTEDNDKIVAGSRIGIREGRELPWRFYICHDPWVSRIKKGQRRAKRTE
jgi:DNA-3-methyladenine glycosylase